jgi:thioredoxin 1
MHNINNIEELDNFIIENNSNVILLYFGASWCGPCNKLKEKLCDEECLKSMSLLKVCYIDTDENEELSTMYKIKSLPTQIFIKLDQDKVKIVSKIEGYDYTKLLLEYNNCINKN